MPDPDLVELVARAAYRNWTGHPWSFPAGREGVFSAAMRSRWLGQAEAILDALDGRLLPEGVDVRVEWGIQDATGKVYPAEDESDAWFLAASNPLVWVATRRCYDGQWAKVEGGEA